MSETSVHMAVRLGAGLCLGLSVLVASMPGAGRFSGLIREATRALKSSRATGFGAEGVKSGTGPF